MEGIHHKSKFNSGQFTTDVVPDDSELWDAVQNSDSERAFSSLFNRYWSKIYTTTFSYLKNAEQSEEITHDIFINLWHRRHFLVIHSFSAYLRAAARYHVYKHMKAEKSSPVDFTSDWNKVEMPMVVNAGHEKIRHKEFEDGINQILLDLPPRCQEVFLLSRKDNLTNDEIANRLGISKRSVENQLTRALQHIRIRAKTLMTWMIFSFLSFFL